jgi:FtsZ-interacting cell division protein ZipA
VRALAEAAGLRLEAEGGFHCYDEHGVSLFTLRNSEPRPFLLDQVRYITTHGITLLLDVPRVAHGVQVFDQMLTLARHIAVTLGGEVVDDNRKPLTDAGADSIRRSLGLIYRQMDGFGITAGSALALRLFS